MSPLTIPTYRTTLGKLRTWLIQAAPEVRSPVDLPRTHLRLFVRWLATEPVAGGASPLGPASVDKALYSVRSWLAFLRAETDLAVITPEAVRVPRHDPALPRVVPTPSQVRSIIERCDRETVVGRRDRAILLTLFSAGLRIAELCSLDREQLAHDELGRHDLYQIPVKGKGRKVRGIFLTRETQRAMRAMLDDRAADADPCLFRRYRPGKAAHEVGSLRLGPRPIQTLVATLCKEAGLPAGISPHALRHAFALDCLKGGADLVAVQQMLGHSSVVTTQRYLHLDSFHLQESYRKRQTWQEETSPPPPDLRILTRFGKEIAG